MWRRLSWSALVLTAIVLPIVPTGSSSATQSGWGRAIVLDAGGESPSVGMDFAGNAVVVWESDGNVSAGRYDSNQPFRRTAMIENGDAISSAPKVAVSRAGTAISVWLQRNDSAESVSASHSRLAATQWAAPVRLGAARFVFDPHVAIDPGGNGFAVWALVTDSAHIWASRFLVDASRWSAPVEIGDTPGWNAYPRVAVDAQGNAIAVWAQDDGAAIRIWTNRFETGTGLWGAATAISQPFPWSGFSKTFARPDVAVGANGTAIAAWTYFDGDRLGIAANRWEPSGGWGDPIAIDGAGFVDGMLPSVAVDAADNGVAVWGQGIAAAGALDLWANRFDAILGRWDTPVAIEHGPGAIVPGNVAVDSSGNGLVVWSEFGGTRWDVWASRLNGARGRWGAETFIGSFAAIEPSFSFVPQVALSQEGGLGIAVWAESGASGSTIWANRFLADMTPPPLTLFSPVDGSETVSSTVTVTGTTEAGATITANGILGSVHPDGSFALALALAPGSNIITVTAEDDGGNVAIVAVTVTYFDRVPSLEERLTKVLDTLTDVRKDLADQGDALAGANATLGLLSSEVLVLLALLLAVLGFNGTLLFLYLGLRRRTNNGLAESLKGSLSKRFRR